MNGIIYAGRGADGELKRKSGYKIICAARDGKITANGEYPYKAGDVIVIPPLITFGADAQADITVILDNALLPVKRVTVIDSADNFRLSDICAQALHYFNGDARTREIVLPAIGGLIAAYITSFTESDGYSPVVKTVMSDADKNLGNATYSQENFMRGLPLNYDYIRKLFKKETGVTPHGYITGARMELAKSIILSGVSNQYSDYSVSQIAEMCGYSEPLYFSRVFKKYFGVAPSNYKQFTENSK